MLSSYLRTAFRALKRHSGSTSINVVGLGVGIAVTVLLLLFVRSELAVNDLFPNADRIHRIDTAHRQRQQHSVHRHQSRGRDHQARRAGRRDADLAVRPLDDGRDRGGLLPLRHLPDERRVLRCLRPAAPAWHARDGSRRAALRCPAGGRGAHPVRHVRRGGADPRHVHLPQRYAVLHRDGRLGKTAPQLRDAVPRGRIHDG